MLNTFHACFLRESALGHGDALMATFVVSGPALCHASLCSSSNTTIYEIFYRLGRRIVRGRHLCCYRWFRSQNSFKHCHQTESCVRFSLWTIQCSQPQLLLRHESYGGIYPYSAISSHQNNMVCPLASSFPTTQCSPPLYSRMLYGKLWMTPV